MIVKIVGLLLALQIFAAPIAAFSQYFQRLYDVDSSQEWGTNIFIKPDSTYFIFGTQINTTTTDKWKLFNLTISSDGSTILGKKILKYDSLDLFMGLPGEMKKLRNGYLCPMSVQWSFGTYWRGWAGFLKYNSVGDTVLLKTFTDTSIYFDVMACCAMLPDSTYIFGGLHDLNTPSSYPGYLIHTDSIGDTIWTHSYKKYSGQSAIINNIIPLLDGRIVVGAMTTFQEYISGFGNIDHNSPWLMLLNNMGVILKDTVYGSKYMIGRKGACGELYADVNGGYIVIGNFDSLVTSDPSDPQNFPAYIAHLDTDFRITWITELSYVSDEGHRQGVLVRQLHDSTYLMVGDSWDTTSYDKGFAAKIGRTGDIIWSHSYVSQPLQNAYLRDAIEKPDGSIVLTGTTFNDTLPSWHQHRDMWLIDIDSNGCEVANCNISAVPPNPIKTELNFSIFPNPTSGNLSVRASKSGKLIVYNLLGQKIAEYTIRGTTMDLQLPSWMSAGLYLGRFNSDDGFESEEIRIVYQP